MHTAAACFAAGAAGIVLDNQLLLTRESPLRGKRGRGSGPWTAARPVFGSALGATFRALRGDSAMTDILSRMEAAELIAHEDLDQARESWRAALNQSVDWERRRAVVAGRAGRRIRLRLCRSYVTVGGVANGDASLGCRPLPAGQRTLALAAGGPLAESHGTRYPIVQGPMTRVSDRARFAEAVAEAGALAVPGPGPDAWRGGPPPFCTRPPSSWPGALGRRHPRVRPAGAARGAARGRPGAPAPVRPDRRRAARPGEGAGGRTGSPPTCTCPRPACCGCSCRTAPGGSCSRAASAAGTSGRGRASCSGRR